MVLLRELVGAELRRRRTDQGRTLRDVAAAARVSLGYLSEVERGRKEASSELLSAICQGLDARVSDLLLSISLQAAVSEVMDEAVRAQGEPVSV